MSEKSPIVSVILPTYNRVTTLPRAIYSVLEQTHEDLELIVVNDASTDGTGEFLEGITDSRVEVLTHEVNRGAAAARNTGLSHSSGEFIAFQDSDDEWNRDKLEQQLETFSMLSCDIGVVYSRLNRHQPDGSIDIRPTDMPRGDVKDVLLRNNFVSIQTTLVRKQCFEDFGGFDERFPRLIDWEFWLRVSNSYRFFPIEETLVDSYLQPDSISTDDWSLLQARTLLVEKYRNEMSSAVAAMHLFRTGHVGIKVGDDSTGRKFILAALRTFPRVSYLVATVLAGLSPGAYRRLYRTAKWMSGRFYG